MISSRLRILGVCGVIGPVLAMGLGGCKSVSQSEYDQAVAENSELRDRLESVQGNLRSSEDEKAAAVQRNDSLSAEVARLQSELSTAKTQPATTRGNGISTRPSDVVLTVAGDVLFSSGQATLKADGKRELDRVARMILSEYPANLVRVEGYTDTDRIRKSKWQTNERLAAERALAVESYLVSRGVDADQIYAASMGPATPKSTKSASRRVEIVILSAS